MNLRRLTAALPILVVATPVHAFQNQSAPRLSSEAVNGLELRSIGPAASGGRISDIAIDPTNSSTWYVSTASGGVWKTTNAGATWAPIFEHEGSYSIGVVEVDPKNPRVIWVGTGENTSQRSVGFGDGVYKSEDGGATWRHVGLETSEHIGAIVIDPRNSDVVFVAAQGPLWRSGGDRGLYRTTDGGRTWTRVLFVSDETGVSDVVLNPRNPDVMYATSYQRRRHLGLQIAGGPESGIYKSVDGGRTWKRLTDDLPGGNVGRIGLALSPQNPDVVYAIIAATEKNGGFFRSANAGMTWVKQSDYVPGDPQYYMELYPDPHRPGRIYTLDVQPKITDDEGKTWHNAPTRGVHVDHHAYAFFADDPDHILNGNDGGLYESYDNGETWEWFPNMPISQFYHIDLDDAEPFYNVYGGLQDNGSLMGPSRTLTASIPNHEWITIGGGDGMQPRAEPGGARYVYVQSQNGSLSRLDRWTGESVGIRPRDEDSEEEPDRYTWNAPLLISPHSPTRVYFGSHVLLRSDDRGNTWREVSGDLTRDINRDTLPVMGRIWGEDAVGRNLYTNTLSTIIAIDESPLVEGLLMVGTDDGLLQISENGGANWRTARLPGLPDLGAVVEVTASRHDDDVMYAVAQNFQRGDFKPYLYRSADRGRTWTSIVGNLPARHITWSLVEDHVNPNLLFVGTEFGLFFTLDGGRAWTQLKGGLPTIMFRDLAIHRRDNDLVAGTFGRGIFIFDDYAPLRALTPALLASEGALLPVRDAWSFTTRRGAADEGRFSSPNPPYGALLTYYVRDSSLRPMVVRITNAAGAVLADVEAPAEAGLQRVAWNLREVPRDTADAESGQERGGRRRQGRAVEPGEYAAQLGRLDGDRFTPIGDVQRFRVKAVPPIPPR